jgi:LysM repeat protein
VHGSADAETGAAIDLYTSSTLFEPQELVVLYALAIYNAYPVQQKEVAFEVNGPPNPFQNLTFIGTGITDENGTATYSFRIPWPSENPESIVFGEWSVVATVSIAGQVAVDTLTFRVGWIIQITQIATLNSLLQPQSVFTLEEPIVFNLTVENIATTAESATITIDVQDSEQHPIIHIELKPMLFQPGNNNVQAASQIPISADSGLANASAAPFTAPPESGGTLYSPAIYTTFQIAVADIAVTNIKLSSTVVFVGQTLGINVTVVDTSNEPATFNVSTYYNSSVIETLYGVELAPFAQETFAFTWNTTLVEPGFYQISASAPLPGDPTPWDNTLVDGIVQVKTVVPPPYWLVFSIIVGLGVVAGLIMLFLILCLDRIRRRKRPRPTYTVIVRPHI